MNTKSIFLSLVFILLVATSVATTQPSSVIDAENLPNSFWSR